MKLLIDSERSSVEFTIKNLFFFTAKGYLRNISGQLDLNSEQPELSSIHAEVALADITTNNPQRDQHLRNKDFFEIDKYPTAIFESKNITSINETEYQIMGDLALHGITQEVVLVVKKENVHDGDTTFEALTILHRNDFGLVWGPIMIENNVNVKIVINTIPA